MSENASRGRPRAFDEDAVIDRVLSVLWSCGYHSTSMNDLARELGLSKPSIYNAFGGKAELLKLALTRYNDNINAQVAKLPALHQPTAFVRAYWQILIEQFCDEALPNSCFIVSSTMECGQDEELSGFIDELHAQSKAWLMERLRQDQERGTLTTSVELDALANYIRGQGFALAIMARSGADRKALELFADTARTALEALCAPQK